MAASHEQWHRRISDYQDGGLSAKERAQVEAHLVTCAECQHVLQHYQDLYQGLRATRGFDGLPTVAKPLRRWHFPRQPFPAEDASGRRPQLVSGMVAILLVLVMALTVVAGRTELLLGPQHELATPLSNLDGNLTPTYGPQTTTGAPCANVQSFDAVPYTYAVDAGKGNGATLWLVNGCEDPTQFATLPYGNFSVLSWSPDLQNLLVIDRDNPQAPTLASVSANGHVVSILGQDHPVDEASWISATQVLVLSRGTVLTVNMVRNQVQPILDHVGHLAWRAGNLFYSQVNHGVATLHQRNLSSGVDTVVFQLGAGGDTCPTVGGVCNWTEAWDVSSDGLHVAYQSPLPTSVVTAATKQLPAQLIYSGLQGSPGTTPTPSPLPQTLFALPITATPSLVQIAPHMTRVAAQAPGAANVMIYELISGKSFGIPANDTFVWRNDDDRALLTAPFFTDRKTAAQLYLFTTGQSFAQSAGASNFTWQLTGSG